MAGTLVEHCADDRGLRIAIPRTLSATTYATRRGIALGTQIAAPTANSCYPLTMYALVIQVPQGDRAVSAPTLATALGVSPYEARSRLQVPEGGPAIAATYASADQAQPVAARLQALGVQTWICDGSIAKEVGAFQVRSFELATSGLRCTSRDNMHREVEWSEVELIVHGISTVSETTHENHKKRELSLGRAIVSGGLMVHKTTTTQSTSTKSTSEGVLVLYSSNWPPICLREYGLLFQSLGDQMRPARAANFIYLTDVIRKHASNAIFDNRLVRRVIQQQILGATLDADTYFDFAVALIATAHGVASPDS